MIIINGPIGIGKTWLSQRILPLIEGSRRCLGLQSIVWLRLQAKVRWAGSYIDFKNHLFEDGLTGREHMIQYIEDKRAVDTHFWDRQFISNPLFLDSDIIVNDSFRKPEEQEFFAARTDLVTIVIAPSRYKTGCLFDEGDSGVCLPPWGGYRVSDSDEALAKFQDFWRQRINANANSSLGPIGDTSSDSSTRNIGVGGLVG